MAACLQMCDYEKEGERLVAACDAPEADRAAIIDEIIRLFDGPRQREAERLTREALADGETWQYR
ncbi:MAG: hypothetical protein JO051_12565 [Acidobacteriaceae bacterium]|nr:hypothetical protein [Acidobacteriaceae bacterium]